MMDSHHSLETLILWLGPNIHTTSVTKKHIKSFLRTAKFPKLKRLGIMNSEFGRTICNEIVKSPLLPQLEELNLSMGTLMDDEVRVLLQNHETWYHLKVLNLEQNFLTSATLKLFTKYPQVRCQNQRTIEDVDVHGRPYRYVAIGELHNTK
jgi:hypothetical protein